MFLTRATFLLSFIGLANLFLYWMALSFHGSFLMGVIVSIKTIQVNSLWLKLSLYFV